MADKTGNFLSGFGEGLLKTLQSEREKRQQEQQFNQKMAFETRQMNLLNVYRQKQLEMQGSQPFETKTGEVYPSQGGVPNFDKPLWTPPDAPQKPQTFDIEGSYKNPETGTYWTFDKNEGKPKDLGIPYDKSEGKPTNGGKEETTKTPKAPDLSNEIDDLEYWYREYTNKNDEPSLQNVKAKSDALMSKAGLIGEVDMVWNAYKEGLSYGKTVEAINNYRVKSGEPELTDWQIDALRRYYNSRVPKAYKK